MQHIIANALGFFVAIFLGFLAKKRKILSPADAKSISKIIIYFTLPATLVKGINGTQVSIMLLVLISLGFLMNVTGILVGYLIEKTSLKVQEKQLVTSNGSLLSQEDSDPIQAKNMRKALMMFTVSGYNIGNFVIPFASQFVPTAVPYVGMFTLGNSVMTAGSTELLIDKINKQNKAKENFGLIQALRNAPALSVCIFMIGLSTFGIVLPDTIMRPAAFIANANAFLAMFVVGLGLNFRLQKEKLSLVLRIILSRYILGTIFTLMALYLLPVSDIIKITLALLALGPIANINVIQAIRYGCDEESGSLAASISIILSLIILSIFVTTITYI